MGNIFSSLPLELKDEVFEDLFSAHNVRIERILSKGHSSPLQGWYDQEEGEWIIVLEGSARILFEVDAVDVVLNRGDYLNIPPHSKHRVSWTDPDTLTIWLAVFYS